MPSPDHERRIAGVAALDQPLRRDLYRLLDDEAWTTRDDAASALDVPRSVVAFHLDKLADAGVVEVRFERTSGRRGPGAGRPSKLYRRSPEEVAASVPDRHYDLAGSVLATAIAESSSAGTPVDACVRDVARRTGRTIGEAASGAVASARGAKAKRAAVVDVLADHGYEPEVDRSEICLANCPFHRLADEHRDLVCGMNLELLTGVVEGANAELDARLDPKPGRCCVVLSTR